MDLWDVVLRILIVCLFGLVLGVFLLLSVDTLRSLGRRLRLYCGYKRAEIVPVEVAKVTTAPVDCYAIDVETAQVISIDTA